MPCGADKMSQGRKHINHSDRVRTAAQHTLHFATARPTARSGASSQFYSGQASFQHDSKTAKKQRHRYSYRQNRRKSTEFFGKTRKVHGAIFMFGSKPSRTRRSRVEKSIHPKHAFMRVENRYKNNVQRDCLILSPAWPWTSRTGYM